MPTYDLKCTACGETLTVFVSMKDRDKVTCPKCGFNKLKQVYKSVQIGKSGTGSSCKSGGFS